MTARLAAWAALAALVLANPAGAAEVPDLTKTHPTGATAPGDAALVVGIETYTWLPSADYARRDALVFNRWLEDYRGVQDIVSLAGPTRDELLKAARLQADKAAGGVLWIYFSGHGYAAADGGQVLVAVDARQTADDIRSKSVTVAELQAIGAASGASQTVLVIDACFNSRDRNGGSLTSERLSISARELTSPKKVTTWSAVARNETARPYRPAKHGSFTYFAVGALRGWADGQVGAPDGKVTLNEAQRFVEAALGTMAMGQTPTLLGDKALQALGAGVEASPMTLASFPRDGERPHQEEKTIEQLIAEQRAWEQRRDALVVERQAAARAEWASIEAAARPGTPQGVAMVEAFVAKWTRTCPERQAVDPQVCPATVELPDPGGSTTRLSVQIAELGKTTALLARLRQPVAVGGGVQAGSLLDEHGYEMLWVEPGSFWMGSPGTEEGRDSDEERHKVTLTKGFFLGRTEVTQALWQEVMTGNPTAEVASDEWGTSCSSPTPSVGDDHPVACVSWFDVLRFCNRLSEKQGLRPAYRFAGKEVTWDRAADGFRLPTEAEWEYAARADDGTRYAGSDRVEAVAWAAGKYEEGSRPVAGKDANGWGFHDLSGNVWEWVWDAKEVYPSTPQQDPAVDGSPDSIRVIRGGSWSDSPASARVAYRYWYAPSGRWSDLGFRVARSR